MASVSYTHLDVYKRQAIATVPMQRFEKLYPLEKALAHGTLFQALDLPFRPWEGGEQHA